MREGEKEREQFLQEMLINAFCKQYCPFWSLKHLTNPRTLRTNRNQGQQNGVVGKSAWCSA